MIYAATIFLSSFLLFLVQPLIARQILPWFGGSASVWTTCMLFFQVLLLAGYGYAHWLNTRVHGRAQAIVHSALLLVAVFLLPITPSEAWKPTGSEEPISRILILLTVTVGLPYFLLASTSPLIQAWYARRHPGANPYRLFALSNLASLAALIGFPFVVEPWLGNREQVAAWSGLFALFALACGSLAWRTPAASESMIAARAASPLTARQVLLWLGLAAAASMLLLAVTNHVTQNIAAIPLLWLAPLTLYLLSFILTFEGRSFWHPRWMWAILLAALGVMAWQLVDGEYRFDLTIQLATYLGGLFIACMFCHGELYRARPGAGHLTAFYVAVSAGGAIGGLLVAVVAPFAFDAYYELGIALAFIGVLAAIRFIDVGRAAVAASVLAALGIAGCAAWDGYHYHDQVRYASRGFFGVLRVKEYGNAKNEDYLRRLLHGVIMHGEQFLSSDFKTLPTSYYRPQSGVGAAIAAKQAAGPARIGVIGLGTGTLASYGREGDVIRFYDIDPHVVDVAWREFSYLGDSKAKIEIALGDARLSLEREPPQRLDVLAVDAFSSDAIPVHLITREALAAYLRQVKPDGIVAFHLSNRFLNLHPVVRRIAEENGAHSVIVLDRPDDESIYSQSDWVLVSRDAKVLKHPEILAVKPEPVEERKDWRTWTDDYSNLVQIMK